MRRRVAAVAAVAAVIGLVGAVGLSSAAAATKTRAFTETDLGAQISLQGNSFESVYKVTNSLAGSGASV